MNANQIKTSLNELTVDELVALAGEAGLDASKKTKDALVKMLSKAAAEKKLYVKVLVEFRLPVEGNPFGRTVYAKKFRNYRPDKVSYPFQGQPAPDSENTGNLPNLDND